MNIQEQRIKREDVKNYFGTLYKAYKALKNAGHSITFQAVYQWKENVPRKWSERIKSITNGQLKER